MNVTFDGVNKVIAINEGITNIDVKEDIYSSWKAWVVIDNNSAFEQALRAVGGDPLPGSKKLGSTYFVMNGWKIRPYSGDHTLNIDGNLYSEDGSSPFVSALGSVNVMIINSVSSLVDSTVQQLPEIEYASFNGGIHLDPINGVDSIDYPSGTPKTPCKTLINAYQIDLIRGFSKVYLYGNLDIDSYPDGFIKDVTVIGMRGNRQISVTINNTLVENVFIENLNVTGNCKNGSNAKIRECNVTQLENITIIAEDCKINSGIYYDADLNNCFVDGDIVLEENSYFTGVGVVFEGDFTNITMNTNSIVSLDISSGYVLIKNSTSGCLIEVNSQGGELELDSSCTGGIFYAEGSGVLYGNPVELGIDVKANHLMSLETVTESNWSADTTTFSNPSSVGFYLKNKVLSVTKFLGLK